MAAISSAMFAELLIEVNSSYVLAECGQEISALVESLQASVGGVSAVVHPKNPPSQHSDRIRKRHSSHR